MLRVRGLIRPTPFDCASADAAYGEKRLLNWHNQAILPSNGRPLGECRLMFNVDWKFKVNGAKKSDEHVCVEDTRE
jgi:hypothetical protein